MRIQVNTTLDPVIFRKGRCCVDTDKHLMDDETFFARHGNTKAGIGICGNRDQNVKERSGGDSQVDPAETISNNSSRPNNPEGNVWVSLFGTGGDNYCAVHAHLGINQQRREQDDLGNIRGITNEGESPELRKTFAERSAYRLQRATELWDSLVQGRGRFFNINRSLKEVSGPGKTKVSPQKPALPKNTVEEQNPLADIESLENGQAPAPMPTTIENLIKNHKDKPYTAFWD